MAISILLTLPIELLERIVPLVVPEGFESLSLTCKTLNELCAQLIKRYNYLHSHYRVFRYRTPLKKDPFTGNNIWGAYDLLTRISLEPVLARYIEHADLSRDSLPIRPVRAKPEETVDGDGPFVTLFTESPYLEKAGLEWKEYYTSMQKEYRSRGTPEAAYSQHAAEFLLTLLPNVKTLQLPSEWDAEKSNEALLYVIVLAAKQTDVTSSTPSLGKVRRVQIQQTKSCEILTSLSESPNADREIWSSDEEVEYDDE
jgi:hypothetical protein